jgi:AraC-like DNA-binding protein
MDSFFFNITTTAYKTTSIYKSKNSYINRIDISNGIVFFDIDLNKEKNKIFNINNLDRMVFIPVIIDGNLNIVDNIDNNIYNLKKDDIDIFCSTKQNIDFFVNKDGNAKIFILFIADFFLKRYLNKKRNEPIDELYNTIQNDISLYHIDSQPLDALSLYIINKILKIGQKDIMSSIRCEHSVIEFMIHRFSLIDIYSLNISDEDKLIVKRAKQYLLSHYIDSPTIKQIAHFCATNESKLKKLFKQTYEITIHEYIQKLKLEKANLLLKDKILNIGEIANEVGYKHQGYFSKLFFQKYGVYPKDLLK